MLTSAVRLQLPQGSEDGVDVVIVFFRKLVAKRANLVDNQIVGHVPS
jgi:hypothetical protein